MGLGAAVGGQAPQFRQQMMQEDEIARKRGLEDEAAAEKRRQTLFLDAAAGKQFLDAGDISGFQNLMQDRYNILSKIDGVDTSHTKRFLDLANAASQNRVGAADRLRTEIDNTVKAGQAYKMFGEGADSVPSAFRAKQMQAEAAGLQAGTPEYQEFMLYGGAAREEGAKGITRFKDGSYIQITPFGNRVYDPSGTEVTDPEQKRRVIEAGRNEGVLLEGEIATARAQGAAQEGRAQDIITQGQAAADSTAVIRRALQLLETVPTGGLNRVSLAAYRLFGVEGADEGELSANLGKAVLAQLRDTFGAAFTAQEGESLKKIEAGFSSSPETNKRLLNNSLRIAERAAQRAIRRAESRDDFETSSEIESALEFDLSGFNNELDSIYGESQSPVPSANSGSSPRVINFDAQGNRI
jgi:hypothetical protein